MGTSAITGFRSMYDGRAVDVLAHVRNVLSISQDVEVLVGTDSHNRSNHTVYATAIVLRFKKNGAQVIYGREKAPQGKTTSGHGFGGRWNAVLPWPPCCTNPGKIAVQRIDMDLNSDERFGSHKLHSAAMGYIRSHGYEPHTKPDMLIATWAANILCNGTGAKHKPPSR